MSVFPSEHKTMKRKVKIGYKQQETDPENMSFKTTSEYINFEQQ